MKRPWTLSSLTFAALLGLGAIVPGAASGREPPAPAVRAGEHVQTAIQDENYKLGPGDKLRVTTYGEPDLTGEFFVGDSGDVSLPLIGTIHAGGTSIRALITEVTQRLAAGYLKDPRVSIEVLTYRPFYILGEVNKPGEYPYSSGLTIMDAAATAGGFTYRANQGRVMVKHANESQEHSVPLRSGTEVQAGDTIRVLERYF